MQILSGPAGYGGGGKKPIPLPTAELQKAVVARLCGAATGSKEPCFAEGRQGEQQWDISALGYSCTP